MRRSRSERLVEDLDHTYGLGLRRGESRYSFTEEFYCRPANMKGQGMTRVNWLSQDLGVGLMDHVSRPPRLGLSHRRRRDRPEGGSIIAIRDSRQLPGHLSDLRRADSLLAKYVQVVETSLSPGHQGVRVVALR